MAEALNEALFWLGVVWLVGGSALLFLGWLSGKRKGGECEQ